MSGLLPLDRRISGNALLKLSSELVGRVASFVLTLWAARRLGEADFGLYNYGLALGFVLAQLADMGLQVLIAREVAVFGRQARPLVQQALRLKVVLSLPVLGLLWWLLAGRAPLVQAGLLALGVAMLGQTFLEFAAYVFRGQQALQEEARLLAVARLLTAGLGGVVLWLDGGLAGLGFATLAAVTLTTGWAYWRLQQAGWLGAFKGQRPAAGAPLWPWETVLRQAVPLGVAIFLSIAYTRLAIFLLAYRLDEVAVAEYSAAHRLVEPMQIVPAALLAAVFPVFSGLVHSDPRQARRLGLNTTVLLALAGVGLALFFWLAAPLLIMTLYGEAFAGSVAVLRFLGLSALPATINYGLTHFLIARGQQLFSSLYVGLMLFFHLALSWWLIPTQGAAGPALSVVAAEGILFLCCLLTLALTKPGKVPANGG
ncbi:MAG: flippase [Chloroflexi bacterium]|nr:flippase [Chloroflexota bacterium]MCI0576638.1 flippase [Chloroflexota bacterium]MCI0646994.1 flippase [Chloroflexota bacterium]MCI0730694.1 flippase [Chloroflexota bacterium]